MIYQNTFIDFIENDLLNLSDELFRRKNKEDLKVYLSEFKDIELVLCNLPYIEEEILQYFEEHEKYSQVEAIFWCLDVMHTVTLYIQAAGSTPSSNSNGEETTAQEKVSESDEENADNTFQQLSLLYKIQKVLADFKEKRTLFPKINEIITELITQLGKLLPDFKRSKWLSLIVGNWASSLYVKYLEPIMNYNKTSRIISRIVCTFIFVLLLNPAFKMLRNLHNTFFDGIL